MPFSRDGGCCEPWMAGRMGWILGSTPRTRRLGMQWSFRTHFGASSRSSSADAWEPPLPFLTGTEWGHSVAPPVALSRHAGPRRSGPCDNTLINLLDGFLLCIASRVGEQRITVLRQD